MPVNTKPAIAAELPPVVTREDCHSWLTEDVLQGEVWVALRGAIRYMQEEPFEEDLDGVSLRPGTVLLEDGRPVVDRSYFYGQLLEFIYWRLRRFGEAQGLDFKGFEDVGLPPRTSGTVQQRLAQHPWGKYVDGDLEVFHFDTKREMQAFMKANGMSRKKKAPAGAANTPEAMTNFDRSKADGTDCRA